MNPALAGTTQDATRARLGPWAERRTTGIEGLLHALDDGVRLRVLELTRQTRRFAKGDVLYNAGATVATLFAVQAGSVKTAVGLHDGRRQLVGFHIAGDIVGLAGLANGRHAEDAVAAEPTEVGLLPYVELAKLARDFPTLHANLTRLLAVTSARGRQSVLRLASDSARARVAGFLLVMGARFALRGQGPLEYMLPLTNQEIGSLLGLTSETVSRTFSAFAREKLASREGRLVEISDPERLQKIAAETLLGTAARGADADAPLAS